MKHKQRIIKKNKVSKTNTPVKNYELPVKTEIQFLVKARLTRVHVSVLRSRSSDEGEHPADKAADGIQGHQADAHFRRDPADGGVGTPVLGHHERVHVQVAEGDAVDRTGNLAVQALRGLCGVKQEPSENGSLDNSKYKSSILTIEYSKVGWTTPSISVGRFQCETGENNYDTYKYTSMCL